MEAVLKELYTSFLLRDLLGKYPARLFFVIFIFSPILATTRDHQRHHRRSISCLSFFVRWLGLDSRMGPPALHRATSMALLPLRRRQCRRRQSRVKRYRTVFANSVS